MSDKGSVGWSPDFRSKLDVKYKVTDEPNTFEKARAAGAAAALARLRTDPKVREAIRDELIRWAQEGTPADEDGEVDRLLVAIAEVMG